MYVFNIIHMTQATRHAAARGRTMHRTRQKVPFGYGEGLEAATAVTHNMTPL